MVPPSLVMARIETRPDGTFRPSEVGEWAVTVGVDDREGRLVDFVAWFFASESRWWLRDNDQCPVLGAEELALAVDCGKTIRLHSTPEGWLRGRGRGVCILRWDLHLAPLFGGVKQIECDGLDLERRLRAMLRRWEPEVVTRRLPPHQADHAA